MRYNIETIKNEDQLYPTVGNYWRDREGVIHIRVSEMGDQRYNFLVVLHEMIEEFLTNQRGIKEEDITNFDIAYEMRRKQGLVEENSEPGFDSEAPYRLEHTASTGFEMLLASMIGVDWKKYEEKINSL